MYAVHRPVVPNSEAAFMIDFSYDTKRAILQVLAQKQKSRIGKRHNFSGDLIHFTVYCKTCV